MTQVLRKEKKFLLARREFYTLKGQLDRVLHGDPHNGASGYRVRSLYFDSIYDRDFNEKAEGVELRRKLRLRIYSPDSPTALLEMKQKQGELQRKRSLLLPRRDAEALAGGDPRCLLRCTGEQRQFALECYGLMTRLCYRPKAVVEYRRTAYIARENHIRITFDRDIAATESCCSLFSPHLLMAPVLDPSAVVLEVKYNGFLLSYIQRLLNAADRPEVSVSKYCRARQSLL